MTYGSFGRGTVLPAGATRVLLTLKKGGQATTFWAEGQKRMRSVVCYCSVYDECWTSDSDQPEPRANDGCRADAATEFTQ